MKRLKLLLKLKECIENEIRLIVDQGCNEVEIYMRIEDRRQVKRMIRKIRSEMLI